MNPNKEMIQQVKNMPNFRFFFSLDHNLRGFHTFEKKELIVLGKKKIILDEISAVRFTQMIQWVKNILSFKYFLAIRS